ncbi:unnamed protein product [Urochloa decumbens]|uniref:DUF4378 domain-containing protein n=1 Tax=Urochloa decumbens TaxID=240449 RepID=A0ABC8XCD2_9POAL
MAQEGAGGAPTPLRLKDLLELDCDSCSAAGFRCYPRRLLGESPAAPAAAMRRLLESPSSLRRRHPSKLSSLSRSLSRRLLSRGGGFWLRRRGEADEIDAAAAPSGSGSVSGACSSETTSTSDDDNSSTGRRGSRCGSDSDFSTATSSASDSMDATAAAVVGSTAAGDDDNEGVKRGSGSSSVSEADDKEEQLSPVAVMDFPSDDDDCACSPSFSLARLQRRNILRPKHKIRRFGSTEELGPVDLETLLAATSDADEAADDDSAHQVIPCRTEEAAPPPQCHEPDEHGLLEQLLDAAGAEHVAQRLLLDFFVEMKRRRGSTEHPEEFSAPAGLQGTLRRKAGRLGQGDGGEVLAAATGWLDGAGSERWGLNDVLRGGEAVVAEMERGRRWMQVGEEEREVGAVVAGMLADQLVDEVVWDLLV